MVDDDDPCRDGTHKVKAVDALFLSTIIIILKYPCTEFGIPIVNKRISVTPIALVGGAACQTSEDFATVAGTMDAAGKAVGGPHARHLKRRLLNGLTERLKAFPPHLLKRSLNDARPADESEDL